MSGKNSRKKTFGDNHSKKTHTKKVHLSDRLTLNVNALITQSEQGWILTLILRRWFQYTNTHTHTHEIYVGAAAQVKNAFEN